MIFWSVFSIDCTPFLVAPCCCKDRLMLSLCDVCLFVHLSVNPPPQTLLNNFCFWENIFLFYSFLVYICFFFFTHFTHWPLFFFSFFSFCPGHFSFCKPFFQKGWRKRASLGLFFSAVGTGLLGACSRLWNKSSTPVLQRFGSPCGQGAGTQTPELKKKQKKKKKTGTNKKQPLS